MDTGTTLVTRLQIHVARWLAKGPASPVILAGTLAFAGLGAAALNATPDSQTGQIPNAVVGTPAAPSYPDDCYADPDGDGSLVCRLSASEMAAYPNAHCHFDYDGDGTYVCHIMRP